MTNIAQLEKLVEDGINALGVLGLERERAELLRTATVDALCEICRCRSEADADPVDEMDLRDAMRAMLTRAENWWRNTQ